MLTKACANMALQGSNSTVSNNITIISRHISKSRCEIVNVHKSQFDDATISELASVIRDILYTKHCNLFTPTYSSFFTNEQLHFVKYTAPYELHHVLHSLSSMLSLICTCKIRNKYIQYSRRLQLQASSNRPCFTPCNVCSEIFCSIEYSLLAYERERSDFQNSDLNYFLISYI